MFCTKLEGPCFSNKLPDGPINLWEPCYSTKVPDDPQTYTLDVLWLQEAEGGEEEEEFPSKGNLPQGPLHGIPRREMPHNYSPPSFTY
jgi:hypothetical protein